MAFIDEGHEVAQRIASKANEVYGTDYHVRWAYIDNRNQVYNGSEYVASIRKNQVMFDRNIGHDRTDLVWIDISEFLNDGGQ